VLPSEVRITLTGASLWGADRVLLATRHGGLRNNDHYYTSFRVHASLVDKNIEPGVVFKTVNLFPSMENPPTAEYFWLQLNFAISRKVEWEEKETSSSQVRTKARSSWKIL
jgi:hypothetical protein